MHSSAIITLFSAASLVAASPMHQLFHKKAIVTDIVTDIVVVTVTANAPAPAATTPPQKAQVQTHTKVVTAAPPPPPASSAPAPSVVIVTQAAPAPSSSVPVKVVAPVSSVVPEPAKVVAPVSSVVPEPAKVVAPVSSAAPVAASSAAPAASQPTDYASTAVFNHNQHRANHSASALAWNQTLADWAAITAKSCVFAHDMNEGTKNYGQNIAAFGASSGTVDATKAVANAITDMWYYGEVGEFPFGLDSPSTTGFDFMHFSQAVWKNTQTVGCASQTCGPNSVLGDVQYSSVYTVCNYFPAGNMLGSFIQNVSPSTGKVGTLLANI